MAVITGKCIWLWYWLWLRRFADYVTCINLRFPGLFLLWIVCTLFISNPVSADTSTSFSLERYLEGIEHAGVLLVEPGGEIVVTSVSYTHLTLPTKA